MRIMKNILSHMLVLSIAVGLLFVSPEIAKADIATVTFGSESYIAESNGEFLVGVYLTGESRIGTYHVEIEYDANRIEYMGGAESGGNGKIVLEGTGVREQIKYMLSFRTLSGGEAYIKVKGALINMGETDNTENFEITELDEAVIDISGEDTVGELPEVEQAGFETEIPHIDSVITIGEKEHYLLDLTQQIPEDVFWSYHTANLMFSGYGASFLTDASQNVYIGYLFDETGEMVCYAYNQQQNLFFPCAVYESGEQRYLYTSVDACSVWPDELSRDAVKEQSVVYAINEAGYGMFGYVDAEGNLVQWSADAAKDAQEKQNSKLLLVFLVAVIVIVIILGIVFFTTREKQRKKNALDKVRERKKNQSEEGRKQQRQKKKAEMQVEVADLEQATTQLPSIEEGLLKEAENEIADAENLTPAGAPVIEVQDVTMRFKIATNNVSGIKEYIIQLLKKQISYRELLALDHVSFNVYKGEVVGIIGTNGSGKSTLLRIVSGALAPTEGKVRVNRKKLQLLTLGTGFDMELTAKENVYLNGAIIGYTEEFINEHYDEIVKFAELEGFMEEKVKNFSSGMVSRLGFAIATVGEASEILILDEVLSVGDEFFQKKSLERVKEMIHGGSTVLMVSHSMKTILNHCTKVVWIEKGKLKMLGEPKEVCKEYQKQFEDKDTKKLVMNGLIKEGNVWYLYKNGQLDKETSLARNRHGWWYVKEGKIDFTYQGLVKNDKGIWYVSNGRIDFSYSGAFEWQGNMYKIVNGKVIEQK